MIRKPNFPNILSVLDRKKPARPTLFELFMNPALYSTYSAHEIPESSDPFYDLRLQIRGFKNSGYDYATIHGSDFNFQRTERTKHKSISLNESPVITSRESFNSYTWPDPESADYSRLDVLADELPDGMKFIVMGPGGVLENVIALTGFDNLCFMTADDPDLAADIFDAVGSRLVRYYEICGTYGSVGAMISNDDWGFNTQTMLSPQDMRKYVFPWHKKIVDAIHNTGRPAILHSCGNLEAVMEDIIGMGYDGKHSYEDNIMPIEESYDRYGGRIALLGGIDVNFLCTTSLEEIRKRSENMLRRSSSLGGYALGSGNSIPEYVPIESFKAMIEPAFSF
jgi:uroporphyrinogen decarboxylase